MITPNMKIKYKIMKAAQPSESKAASGIIQKGTHKTPPPITYQTQKLTPKEILPCENFLITFFI